MKNIFITLFFFLFEIFFSQNIKIKVFDTFGKQLSNVNVQLQENGKTLQFKKTDQQGICDFNISIKGIYTLKFTSILYKAKLVEINTNNKSDFEVVLENQITEIKEVEIKSRPKIATAKGDTISYNIKSVKDGTERTAEDLIKKLPGLDINENGKVTNNGNVVGQVLVDGNELFGRNHKMATQNITADMIEGVDLWQNYTTISGNQSSALNLKLKDEYKARVTGNAEANYGNKGSYLGHANVFKFGKAGNLALIADANSIGKDPIGIMDFYEMNKQEEIDNTDGVTSVDTPSFLNNDGRIKSKDNVFGALQYSKSGKKLSVTAFSIFDTSQLEKLSTINRNAFPGQPANYNFFESKSEKNSGYFGTLQVKVKRTFTDNSFLYYSFGYNPSEDKFNQDIDRNTFIKNSFFDIGNSIKSTTFGNFLSWNKNFGNSKMTFAFSQQQNNYQSNLDIYSTENLFQSSFNSLGQVLDSDSKKYALDFYLKNKFSFMTVNLRSGYSNKNENASLSEIFTDEAENRTLKTNHFLNEIFAQKFVGAFDFSGTFSAHILNFNQIEKTYFEKNFRIKFQPKANVKTVFAFEYSNKYKSPEFIQLLYNRNYNRNLSYSANSSLFPETLVNTNAFKLNFIRFNLNKGSHFLTMLVYEKANSNFSSDVSNYGQFSETLNVIGNLNDRWFLIVSDDRRIGSSFSLKSKFTGLYTRTNNFINHQHNQTDLKNFEIGQKLRTNFKESPVQFDVGYTFTKSFFEQSLFNTSSSQQNLKFSAGIRTNIKQEWIGNFLGEYLIQKTKQNTMKNFLLGGQISYRKENSLFEYNLTMNNVLNLNSFNYINSSVSLLGTDETSVTALRGYIMGGLKYYF